MGTPAGVDKEATLRGAGFNDTEVDEWKASTQNDLLNAGFSTQEIGEYFGQKDPDMKPLKEVFAQNQAKAQAEKSVEGAAAPKTAETFTEVLEAGWQMSVAGLIKRGKAPDMMLAEDAPMFYRIASQVSGLAGDIPAMISGSLVAGAATAPVAAATGPAAPFVEAAGAGYGAFALPAAVRKVLMDHYEKGDVKDFGDFWERAASTFIEANKQGLVGAATAGVGAGVGKIAAGVGAKAITKTTAQLTSEVATMVTVGKALEGEVPQPQDFLEAAILVGGLHGSIKAAGKLRGLYAQGNVKPSEVAQQALNDPLVKQDLLAEGPKGEVPESLAKANGIPTQIARSEQGLGAATEGGAQSPPTKETKAIERPEAVEKILSQIGEKPEGTNPKYGAREFYKDFVDKLDPINEALKKLDLDPKTLKADENPYVLARMANDYKAKTKYVFEKGTIDFKTLAKNGESFQEIIKPFTKDVEGFDAYLASRRAIEVEGRGLKSGFDVKAAAEVTKLGDKTYREAADRLVQFQNRVLNYVKDSGRISKETYDAMVEANKAYVPFARIIEPEPGTGKAGGSSSLKTFKGSEKQIQSPLTSILENTNALLRLAESNRAGVELVKIAEKTEGQTILEKSKAKAKAVNVSEKEMADFFKEHGIDADPAAMTVFKREQKSELSDNEFAVYRNGKREVWVAKEPALAEAIKSLDGDIPSTNIAFKIASGFTSLKKFSITIMPDFIMKNLFRDQLTMGAFSKGGTRPFVDILPALGDLWKKNDVYYDWLKSGGAQGTFIDINKSYLETKIFELDKKTGLTDATWNVLKKPVDFIQAAGMLAEHATRLAEYKRVTKGETSGTKVFEGGFSSREVTIDFSRVGAKMSALNAITAFQNMQIQGLDRTVRAIKENPAGVGIKAATYITVPSVLLWWANKDDERYKQLPRWQKDLFWVIPVDHWVKADPGQADSLPEYMVRTNSKGEVEINDGPILRVPKPQELGLAFGTIPERALEKFFTDNPNAMKDFGHTIGEMLIPATVPDAVAPIREHWANKSLFTGNKIVSGPIENVLPAYQYNEYTTESAKLLGKMIRTLPGASVLDSGQLALSSPAVLENYVRGWSGSLGMYALQAADVALAKTGIGPDPVKPKDTLADIPFVKAFVIRYPSTGAQPIQDFYNEYAQHEKVSNTISHLAKTGDFTSLEKELSDPQVQDMLVKLSGIHDSLRTQAQFARRIYKNQEFSSSDQRQMLDGIYFGMIETAKMGNELMRTLKEAQKQSGGSK